MQSITYSQLRATLAKTMDEVSSDHSCVLITRAKAKPVVMISLEDYESMQETFYLLKSPLNANRIKASMQEVESLIVKKNKKVK